MRQLLAALALLWLLIAGAWVGFSVAGDLQQIARASGQDRQIGVALGATMSWLVLAAVWCLPPIAMAAVSLALSVFDDKPKANA